MFGTKVLFLSVIWHAHSQAISKTAPQAVDVKVTNTSVSSITLSWETSLKDEYLYYLQKAPAAYVIPPPRRASGSFKFNMDSFVKFSNVTWSISNFNLQLDIRTFTDHRPTPGSLLYIVSGNENTSAILGIESSKLFLKLDCKGNISSYYVDLQNFSSYNGRWFKIKVLAQRHNISIQLMCGKDKVQVVNRYFCEHSQTNSSKVEVFVGGIPSGTAFINNNDVASDNFKVLHGLVGCVRNISVNGQLLDCTSCERSDSNMTPSQKLCFADVESGMHFGMGGYVKYSDKVNTTSGMTHRFRFKTRRQNWVLIYVNQSSSFYSLQLVGGHLVLSQNSNTTFLHHEKPLCDNHWYEVLLSCSTVECSVEINNKTLGDKINAIDIYLDDASLYMGGFPNESPPSDVDTEHSFKGCLQDLSLISNAKYIEEAVNVDLAACPLDVEVMSKCSDFIYENKYIGYDNGFMDGNVVSYQGYRYRIEAKKADGKTFWSKWITAKTKKTEDCRGYVTATECQSIGMYLFIVIVGGSLLIISIIVLIIIIIWLNRKRKKDRDVIISDLAMKERRLTTGQRYVQSDRNQTFANDQRSVDPIEPPYDYTTQPSRENPLNDFRSRQGDEIINLTEYSETNKSEEVIYQNVSRSTGFLMQNCFHDDNGELIYQNVENEEMYGNTEVIRNSITG